MIRRGNPLWLPYWIRIVKHYISATPNQIIKGSHEYITVLGKMSKINRNFLLAILMNLMRLRGKANYHNLSRYSDYREKSYSRWFKRNFDFLELNRLSLEHR